MRLKPFWLGRVRDLNLLTSFFLVTMLLALAIVALTLAVLAALEQRRLRRLGKGIPGPSWLPPFIGNLIPFIRDAHQFDTEAFARGKVSWDSMMGRFALYINDATVLKTVMKSQGQDFTFAPAPVDNSLFGKALVFMHGEEHAYLRKTLVSVFSRKRLTSYLPTVERNTRQHLRLWISECERNNGKGTITVASRAKDMIFDFLMNVFLGTDYDPCLHWRKNYDEMVKGIISFPMNIPGTTFWRAVRARKLLLTDIMTVVQASMESAKEGRKPSSLTDYWMQVLIENSNGQSDDSDIKQLVTELIASFVFAGLDTTVSTMTALFALLSTHTDVLAKIRSEQNQLRPGNNPITAEILNQMTYTTQVMREILRFENPLLSLGFKAERDSTINGIFIPKDTRVVPNVRHVLFADGFSEPHKFDPDRFGPERREHVRNVKHYIPFGVGVHRCAGKNLAEMSILLTIAIASEIADWHRIETDKGSKMIFDITRVPADGCVISIKAR